LEDPSSISGRKMTGFFPFSAASRPALEPTQSSYSVGIMGCFSGGKVAGAWSSPLTCV